jgi:hypothetical protein
MFVCTVYLKVAICQRRGTKLLAPATLARCFRGLAAVKPIALTTKVITERFYSSVATEKASVLSLHQGITGRYRGRNISCLVATAVVHSSTASHGRSRLRTGAQSCTVLPASQPFSTRNGVFPLQPISPWHGLNAVLVGALISQHGHLDKTKAYQTVKK